MIGSLGLKGVTLYTICIVLWMLIEGKLNSTCCKIAVAAISLNNVL